VDEKIEENFEEKENRILIYLILFKYFSQGYKKFI